MISQVPTREPDGGTGEELIVATLNYKQLAAWYDWLPWRDWRLGEQLRITRLVRDEFEALVAKAERQRCLGR